MKISVIGTGYVGLVTGTCFADYGNDVICMDNNEAKIEELKNGKVPIFEPGLDDLVRRGLRENRLIFTKDIQKTITSSDVIFIAVGTPPLGNGGVDLSTIYNVAAEIGKHINDYKIIVIKSTVPVGTTKEVQKIIKEHSKQDFDVVFNPEFLREGKAVKDFQVPDRIVLGVESKKAEKIMRGLYTGFERPDTPILITDISSAELSKYACNMFLATKISFANELSALCEEVGADIKDVIKVMGTDNRIGPKFLQAGVGYGGSCFPKDIKALIRMEEEYGLESYIPRAVETINLIQKQNIINKLKSFFPSLEDMIIGIWGLAFKPETDDIREAPALTIIKYLLEENAIVKAFDPEAMENFKKIYPKINYVSNPYEAVEDADAVILVTEWNVFRNLDMGKVKNLMKQPVLIDGRNIYIPKEMRDLGFEYRGVGRK